MMTPHDHRLAAYPKPVRDYLIADRQWPRHLRIAHAEHQLAQCKPDMKSFWQTIIKANRDEPVRR